MSQKYEFYRVTDELREAVAQFEGEVFSSQMSVASGANDKGYP